MTETTAIHKETAAKDMPISVVGLDSAENTSEKTADEKAKAAIGRVAAANSRGSLAPSNCVLLIVSQPPYPPHPLPDSPVSVPLPRLFQWEN